MNNLTPKLTPEDVKEMQRLREEGVMVKDIAEKFGVSEATVSSRTKSKVPERGCDLKSKAHWPEWELWRNLHKRYGKRVAGGRDGNSDVNTGFV